ncbi:AAA family ATPase [Burkholderia cepacia]|uniref:AAA family ATPase n=1 Tax=Burkholderia cepacia TaxID=292 RepID=UPI0026546DF9|nr:AAA family ATPase [Burkholderia cepacia]MDN7910094.1 AAA family ATPase [Burkholderia cepacia]
MPAKLITAIRIKKLFGLYTYDLPSNGELSNAAILYGDNGVGKSTLLRLAFHLLSAANNRGHRGALLKVDFESLEVDLASGVTLAASIRYEGDKKILYLTILKENNTLVIWEHFPKSEQAFLIDAESFDFEFNNDGSHVIRKRIRRNAKSEVDSIPRGNEAYLSVLSQYAPKAFILNAERRLDSDVVADPSDEVELRRVMRYDEPKRINELVARSREIALSQALSSAARWVGQKAIIGTNQGSMNVHSVYTDVLHRLIAPSSPQSKPSDNVAVPQLLKTLVDIEERTADHAKYEFSTILSTADFRKALSTRSKGRSQLAAQLLQPYIRSLERRLDGIDPIYRLIDKFVKTLNGFLRDKEITFKLSQGFGIQNSRGHPLSPAQLSSGEQQLLLLFCYVLTARDEPSVFMIDEPEISLNVKWQRQLIQALLDITEGATIQFVFASHSMELLAQHRSRVVKLENKS